MIRMVAVFLARPIALALHRLGLRARETEQRVDLAPEALGQRIVAEVMRRACPDARPAAAVVEQLRGRQLALDRRDQGAAALRRDEAGDGEQIGRVSAARDGSGIGEQPRPHGLAHCGEAGRVRLLVRPAEPDARQQAQAASFLRT